MRLRHPLRRRENPLRRLERREMTFGDATIRVHEGWNLRPADAEAADVTTFVLVHGLGVSSQYFVPLAETLSVHGRVVLLDLPGFAGLPAPRRPFGIADFAGAVDRALTELEVADPVLVGHSMGAQVVVELLAGRPQLSSSAVLVGPVVNAAERTLPQVLGRFAQSAARESPANAGVAIAAYLRCGLRWLTETMPALVRYPIEERLALTSAQLLVIGGGYDTTSPLAWRERLAASAGGPATVVTIEGAAHGVVFDHAPVLAEKILTHAGIGTGGVM